MKPGIYRSTMYITIMTLLLFSFSSCTSVLNTSQSTLVITPAATPTYALVTYEQSPYFSIIPIEGWTVKPDSASELGVTYVKGDHQLRVQVYIDKEYWNQYGYSDTQKVTKNLCVNANNCTLVAGPNTGDLDGKHCFLAGAESTTEDGQIYVQSLHITESPKQKVIIGVTDISPKGSSQSTNDGESETMKMLKSFKFK